MVLYEYSFNILPSQGKEPTCFSKHYIFDTAANAKHFVWEHAM